MCGMEAYDRTCEFPTKQLINDGVFFCSLCDGKHPGNAVPANLTGAFEQVKLQNEVRVAY